MFKDKLFATFTPLLSLRESPRVSMRTIRGKELFPLLPFAPLLSLRELPWSEPANDQSYFKTSNSGSSNQNTVENNFEFFFQHIFYLFKINFLIQFPFH